MKYVAGATFVLLGALTSPPPITLAHAASPLPGRTPAALADRVFTDPSMTIRARPNQLFLIALAANRTTGYTWQVVPQPETIVEAIGSSYAPANSTRLGAGGQQLWVLRTTKAGTTALTFRYVRPFDKMSFSGAKQLTFEVEVGP
jgi:inhibitor of cysteine peptidase